MIAVAVVRVVAIIAVVVVVAVGGVGVADTNPHSTGSNKFQFPAK